MKRIYDGYIVSIQSKLPRRPSSVRNSRPTEVYRGISKQSWAKNHVPVYYKIFHHTCRHKAIFNELVGYRIARKYGFRVPRNVCLCPCNINLIPGPSRCLSNEDYKSSFLSGIASVDANPRNVHQLVNGRISPLMYRELLNWEQLPKVAVFDELVLNVDRTGYNLFRVGKNDFMLIDHAEIFGGQNWSLNNLKNLLGNPSSANYVANMIAESQIAELEQRMMTEAISWANKLEITEKTLGEEYSVIDKFCKLEMGTTEQIVGLLNERIKRLPEFLFHHIKFAQFNFQ